MAIAQQPAMNFWVMGWTIVALLGVCIGLTVAGIFLPMVGATVTAVINLLVFAAALSVFSHGAEKSLFGKTDNAEIGVRWWDHVWIWGGVLLLGLAGVASIPLLALGIAPFFFNIFAPVLSGVSILSVGWSFYRVGSIGAKLF